MPTTSAGHRCGFGGTPPEDGAAAALVGDLVGRFVTLYAKAARAVNAPTGAPRFAIRLY
jgi:hypothetical protein